jgi:hypothetical protein
MTFSDYRGSFLKFYQNIGINRNTNGYQKYGNRNGYKKYGGGGIRARMARRDWGRGVCTGKGDCRRGLRAGAVRRKGIAGAEARWGRAVDVDERWEEAEHGARTVNAYITVLSSIDIDIVIIKLTCSYINCYYLQHPLPHEYRWDEQKLEARNLTVDY